MASEYTTSIVLASSTPSDWTMFSAHRIVPISVADNPALPTLGQRISLVREELSGDVRIADVYVSATYVPSNYRPAGMIGIPLGQGEVAAHIDVGG